MPTLFPDMQYLYCADLFAELLQNVHATSNAMFYFCTSTELIHQYATVTPSLMRFLEFKEF